MKDIVIIKQIEKELNIELKKSDKIKALSNGYILNQKDHVTILSLYSCEINNLNYLISPLKDLKHLTNLALGINQLNDISPLKVLIHLTNLDLNSIPVNEFIDKNYKILK